MSLSREKLLDEMGLSPRWELRRQPCVVRAGTSALAIALTDVPSSTPTLDTDDGVAAGEAPKSPALTGAEAPEELVASLGWDQLRQTIATCRACGLCAGRKQAVPGVGDENASWLFVGEGPGAEEDARGEPFVGAAGKLLDAMLAAIDLRRGNDVYIANAVKCRPPGNRTPEAAEMAACWPYLKRQINLIRPRVIVLLGRAAVQAVLGEAGSLASLRGKVLAYRDRELTIPVIVTYHPAYLLRTLSDKAKAWEDLCRARALMREMAASQGVSA